MSFFLTVFDHREKSRRASNQDFKTAVMGAIQKAESPLRSAYEVAMRKTTGSRDYEEVMWAVADGSHLVRQFKEIYESSYQTIVAARKGDPLPIERFRMRLYRFVE
ncbi:MAG TPA: hypothetical protein VEW64_09020 [Methyloceanibacter sp.]|nr:hypothetical protein [Methyloceanibacter sp.]